MDNKLYDQLRRSLSRGVQVAYIPNHAGDSINHPDVEFGFVTSVPPDGTFVFARYWNKYHPGELRTKANSEATPLRNIRIHVHVAQSEVNKALEEWC